MRNLRKTLAEWLYPHDMAELTRKNLGQIKVESSFIENLSMDDYKQFLTDAGTLFRNPTFKAVKDYLISCQIEFAAKEAQDMRQVDFARASINGISIMWEEFERLNGLYEEMVKKNDSYDKFDIV